MSLDGFLSVRFTKKRVRRWELGINLIKVFIVIFMVAGAFVTIASINFEVVVEFYTQFLGSSPTPHLPHVYAEFSVVGLKLGIFCPKPSNYAEFQHPSQSGMSLCLEVISLEDSIDKLAQLGYAPAGQITTASHGREIYAYDPDGNRLILHQSISGAKT